MKRAALIGALVASLMAGSTAMANPGGRGHDDHRERPLAQHEEDRASHWAAVRGVHRAHVRQGVYQRPNGYYAHRWVRGERLPVEYYSRPYVIADYRGFGLRVPPRGYHWMRVDGDAVLAAVATGIVLDTMFHVFD